MIVQTKIKVISLGTIEFAIWSLLTFENDVHRENGHNMILPALIQQSIFFSDIVFNDISSRTLVFLLKIEGMKQIYRQLPPSSASRASFS